MGMQRSTLVLLGLALTAVGTLPMRAAAATIYLAPEGKDTWSGGLARPNAAGTDGPVATLERARDLLRQKGADAEKRIIVADGRYTLTEPLILTPEDSGLAVEAAPGARPIFSGGRVIRGFRAGDNGLWVARVPEVADGSRYFDQLFVNGRRATRARTPNKFYSYMGPTGEVPIEGKPGQFLRTTHVPAQVLAPLKGLQEAAIRDVVLVAYHKWCITRRYLGQVKFDTNQIVTTGEKLASFSNWPEGTRFHLENFPAALDEPGEWFLSRDGTLLYKPRPGEDMAQAEVIAPMVTKLLAIEGRPEAGQFVTGVRLQGLTFRHQQRVLPATGYAPYQAAFATDAAVTVDGAHNVAILDCEIGHTAEHALWFRQGCRECRIERSYLHDLGAGGVRIGEGRARPDENSHTDHITVDNNIIRNGGRIYLDAVGVWIGWSPDNVVTHNDIADFFYTGLSVGWRWGYSDSLAKRNNLSFNRVHHLGWAVLSDMGGIYTLGPSEGTIIGNNVFHDIYAYSYGGWGLYTDEGSTGIVMEKNLVYNTKTGSFHQHYGKENVIRNNILAFSQLHQIQATRVEKHRSFAFEKNIVYWDTGAVLSGRWKEIDIQMDRNCYWNAAGAPVKFLDLSLEQWREQEGHDQTSVVADPGFLDPKNHDFRLKPDSPALALGFEPFDYTQAGVYGDPAWGAKAKDVTYAPVDWPPQGPKGAQ
ncbi:MAG: right-handed parallel beta-helix repeat-containing protein [Planctomycetes bacterium]|jgi:hypothetical protein|nr:right-handed parallel beta-helix repeat-containing protein [Planctomycetota bacterium]